MAMASLASSLGWKFITPSGIQRRERFTTRPMPGISTRISSSSAATNSHGAIFSQVRMGMASVTHAATTASVIDRMWRIRKWFEA